MTPRAASLALVTPEVSAFDVASSEFHETGCASDRRQHLRLAAVDLQVPLTARLKYGDDVTLVDLSSGGALVETSKLLRPDADFVLEIVDGRTSEVMPVVSRMLRSEVARLRGGVRYRGACVFKRPFSHPALAAPPPLLRTDAHDFVKLEFALKTIVEGYLTRPAGAEHAARWRDALVDALGRLRAAAERRDDPIDRQLAQLLAAMVPALQRHDPSESAINQLRDLLSRHLPLLAIRTGGQPHALTHERELMTLNICVAADRPVAVTAEFPAGYGLDAAQFRLLKAGAYLAGLIGSWQPPASKPAPPPAVPATPAPSSSEAAAAERRSPASDPQDLPFGWQRVVVRHLDGQILRGYSNDFSAERAHLHVCPSVGCPSAERLLVPIPRLKAVFFVRDLHGNPDRVDAHTFDHRPRARKVEIMFRDGEVMIGSTLNYKANGQGFFLHPASSGSNNIRVYVVTSAIRHMRFI